MKTVNTNRDFCNSRNTGYTPSLFSSADFKAARDSWRLDLCGDADSNSLKTAGMSELLRMRDEDSFDLRNQMNKSPCAPILFGSGAPVASGELKLQYDRILRMALPFGTVGCKYYKSEELLSDILFALSNMYDNMYGENIITDTSFRSWKLFDWWDWYVGAACPLMDILMIIEDAIPRSLIEKYIVPVEFLRHKMRTAPGAEEAMSRIVTLTPLALIKEDRDLLGRLFKECEMLLENHDEGNNMRRDYCCMTHGMPYNVAYGVINLSRIGKAVQILSRSPLAYPLKNKDNLKNMLRCAFAPIMYRGRTLAPMNGRALQYDNNAATILRECHYLTGLFGDEFDREICGLVHMHATKDVTDQLIPPYADGITLEDYRKINSIPNTRMAEAPKTHILSYSFYLNALSEEYSSDEKNSAYMWYSGDICVQHRHSCMVGLRMPSCRTYGYECMNGDNGDGWYTGEGALYLYTPSGSDEFSPVWWQNADKHLIPGTTVDERQREIMFFNKAWRSDRNFVGGVCLDGDYLTAAMDYEAFHNETDEGRSDTGYGRSLPIYNCSLTAKKSYFFFDKGILALGSDIEAHDGYAVRTVIENRILDCDQYIVCDGVRIPFCEGEFTLDRAGRIFVPGLGGYVFPFGERVKGRFYENQGVRFVTIYIDHGTDPSNADYAYFILPNAIEAETEEYEISDIEIISQNRQIHAAKEISSGLVGSVFFDKGKIGNLSADQAMIAMLETDSDGKAVSISACDPTQLREAFSFSLNIPNDLTSDDPCVNITKRENDQLISVRSDSAKGRTYHLFSE